MIAATYIKGNLRALDRAYRTAKSQRFSFFYAKLALLELCGWIEVSMDDIVLRHCARTVRLQDNIDFVEKQIVKRNYGFDYNQNFRNMLVRLVGISACERIEKNIPAAVHTQFVAQLNQLKALRNQLAHTYVTGSTVHIDAPSVTRARFTALYAGLIEYERLLRALKK